MDLTKAKGETWNSLDGKEKGLPLFEKSELERAESIVQALDGMTIDSAKELLEKVSKSITQLTIVHSND